MNVNMEAPDMRGTVLLFNVTVRVTRAGVKLSGSVEIQPVYPEDR